MSNKLHNELRKEFQLERMVLFSDAVFAIAITLLVIEIKIPELHGEQITDKALLGELKHLIPKFLGFIISFMLIGIYWTVHHRMFGYVTSYTPKLLRLNLLFLFFIVLMPFSTGFYGEYTGVALMREQLKVPMSFYVLNFACAGFVNYLMWVYVTNPKNKVAEPPIDPEIAMLARIKSLTVPSVFVLMLIVAFLTNVMFAVYIPILIPVLLKVIQRRVKKKFAAAPNNQNS
jgi:uncharacterized membrane protein